MVFGGLQKLTLSDFPGRIAAIAFTRGCNFRCPYCHNPELVDLPAGAESIPQAAVLRYLDARKDLLQGLVVSGGEPTIQDDLPLFLEAVRGLGLATKVDTNGSHPGRLRQIITDGLVDYVALDVKAPWESYPRIAGMPVDTSAVAESIRVVIDSGVEHEIRTTYGREFLALAQLREIAAAIRGCRRFFLQGFRPSKALDPAVLAYAPPRPEEIEEARVIFQAAGVPVFVR